MDSTLEPSKQDVSNMRIHTTGSRTIVPESTDTPLGWLIATAREAQEGLYTRGRLASRGASSLQEIGPESLFIVDVIIAIPNKDARAS
jgi:hypothetical protein